MQKLKAHIFTFIILFAGTMSGHSQMFSVDDAPKRIQIPSTFFSIGVAPVSFAYSGQTSDPIVKEQVKELEIDNMVLSLNLEYAGVQLFGRIGNRISGLSDKSFLEIGLIMSNKFALIRGPKLFLGIPLQLHTSYTSSSSDTYPDSFNQSFFGGGGGGFIDYRFSRRVILTNHFLPGYGFSGSDGGFFGGAAFYMTGKSQLTILDALFGKALNFGYEFNYKSFDVDGNIYDYDLTVHSITIGIGL